MKKWLWRVALIGVLSLCGCGQIKKEEIETTEVAEHKEENSELDGRQEKVNEEMSSKEEVQSGVETQSNTKEEQKDALEITVQTSQANLTMEQIEILSQKLLLTTQDLLVYEGLQQSSLTATDYKQYYYDFTHEDKPYRLEFCSGADDKLQFVRLVDMESMLNIDIRTSNVEHLLNNTVTMADYLTCDLPAGVTASGYDLYQGHFGGEILVKNSEPCGGIYILDGSRVKPGFSGNELLNVANYENNIYHEEFESLSLSGVPALLTLMTVEEENGTEAQYYSIYFAKEFEFYCYNIRLQTDMFTREEVVNVANSVVFGSRAFGDSEFTFADVSNLEFFFCSGAGGWWTQMYIHEDGTFDGYYVDSNWGITDEDYPNGQVSYSEFYGSFTELAQVDDYTYQVRIDSIEYPKGKGSEIIDGVLYDYGEAYGLQGGENFYIYLPGKRYQELPEDFRLWVNGHYHWAWNGDIEAADAILPFYGFFNVEQGCGFYSYEKIL